MPIRRILSLYDSPVITFVRLHEEYSKASVRSIGYALRISLDKMPIFTSFPCSAWIDQVMLALANSDPK